MTSDGPQVPGQGRALPAVRRVVSRVLSGAGHLCQVQENVMDEQTKKKRAKVLKRVKASRKGKSRLRLVEPVDPKAKARAELRQRFHRIAVGKVGQASAAMATRCLGLQEAGNDLLPVADSLVRELESDTVQADTLVQMAVLCIEVLREALIERFNARTGAANGGSLHPAQEEAFGADAREGDAGASGGAQAQVDQGGRPEST